MDKNTAFFCVIILSFLAALCLLLFYNPMKHMHHEKEEENVGVDDFKWETPIVLVWVNTYGKYILGGMMFLLLIFSSVVVLEHQKNERYYWGACSELSRYTAHQNACFEKFLGTLGKTDSFSQLSMICQKHILCMPYLCMKNEKSKQCLAYRSLQNVVRKLKNRQFRNKIIRTKIKHD